MIFFLNKESNHYQHYQVNYSAQTYHLISLQASLVQSLTLPLSLTGEIIKQIQIKLSLTVLLDKKANHS
jgi:hypothetical protein